MTNDMWAGLDTMTGFERWKWATFSFKGAIRRQGYWGYSYLNAAIFGIPMAVLLMLGAAMAENGSEGFGVFMMGLAFLFIIPMFWSSIAVGAKRCRSIGWAPGLIAVAFVPYAGGIFSLVIGCMPQKPEAHNPDAPSTAEVFS